MEDGRGSLIGKIHTGPMPLGEGPVWDERVQTLHWVDILAGTIFSQRTDDASARKCDVGTEVGCIGLTEDPNRVVAALRSGWHWVDLETGRQEFIADPEANRPDCRFNDGAVDPAGRMWTGTLQDGEINPIGALYRLGADLSVVKMDEGFLCANGIDWSPEGEWMYFVDSRRDAIFRYPFDAATGNLGERKLFVDTRAMPGIPDGISCDADGMLWCAFWDGANVTCFDPAGNVDLVVQVPALRPTSIAFGGSDLRTLFVTSASVGLSGEALKRYPHSGSVMALSVPRPGLASNIFQAKHGGFL